ncbi:hypothetical protein LCGC14_2136820, partial [marine sediment metagenome]
TSKDALTQRYAVEVVLLKEGLPFEVFSRLSDERVMTYYHIILYTKEAEADATRDAH